MSYTAIGNVIIEDSSRTANCGKARYDRKNEVTTLEINPIITENDRVLSGSKIILQYNEEELDRLHIPKQALAITPIEGYQESIVDSLKTGDTLRFKDRMEGSQLTSYFKNGNLDSLKIVGMAKTLYHVFEDSIYQGKNYASGDTIIMMFLEDELDVLKVIGGSEGKYIPDSISNDVDQPIIYSANYIKYRFNEDESDFEG